MTKRTIIPQILVFGTSKCKFCLKQINHLKKTYGTASSKWIYIDLSKNNNMIKIAKGMNIETIPSVVLLSEDNKIIFTRKGIISPDEIFNNLYKYRPSVDKLKPLPFTAEEVPYIQQMQLDGKMLKMFKINSILKLTAKQINENYIRKNIDTYLAKGGNKNYAWAINFQPEKEK